MDYLEKLYQLRTEAGEIKNLYARYRAVNIIDDCIRSRARFEEVKAEFIEAETKVNENDDKFIKEMEITISACKNL